MVDSPTGSRGGGAVPRALVLSCTESVIGRAPAPAAPGAGLKRWLGRLTGKGQRPQGRVHSMERSGVGAARPFASIIRRIDTAQSHASTRVDDGTAGRGLGRRGPGAGRHAGVVGFARCGAAALLRSLPFSRHRSNRRWRRKRPAGRGRSQPELSAAWMT